MDPKSQTKNLATQRLLQGQHQLILL